MTARAKAPLRILHTEASCGWGGQEIRILGEARGMIRRGHQVHLVCPAEARIATEAARWGVPVTALPIGRKNLKGWRALRGFLKGHAFDVVNSHSSTDSWLAALALAGLKNAPRLVRTRHLSAAVPNNVFSRWLYRSATAAIATTGEPICRHLIEDIGVDAERVQSIPTGIDAASYGPALPEERIEIRRRLNIPEAAFVVGIVATLRSWKGHKYLVSAFARFVADHPEAVLVIVGDGPQRAQLEQQVAELGLTQWVLMPGNRHDVADWLKAFDVFCLPSYANEGVPQALLQAMFSGLPCVTTQAGAIGEIALAEQTALVVPMQEDAALAAALARLAENPALRQRLGDAANAWCRANFTEAHMLDRMEALFRHVLAPARPA